MPKIVNHTERREEVMAAIRRVIARGQINDATIRVIAREAGYSAGVLAHYFTDKDEMMTSALRWSHQGIRQRQDEKLASLRGLAALKVLLLDNLPLDEQRTLETKLEVSYWSRALGSSHVLDVQRHEAALLYQKIRRLLEEARDLGEIHRDQPLDEATERFLALIDGLSVHALLYPDRLRAEVQERIMLREVDRLASSADSSSVVDHDRT